MNKAEKKSFPFFLIFLFILISTAILAFFAIFFGAEKISFSSIINGNLKPYEKIIIFEIRLPRILMSLLCGALLGGAGAVFQGFFRNPLADSGIIGISSGASFGAVVSGLIPFASLGLAGFFSPVSIFAFLGAIASGILVFAFSMMIKNKSSVNLLLIGTALGTFLSSMTSMMMLVNRKELFSIFAWTMGSFNAKGWDELKLIVVPSIISMIFLFFCAKRLNILGSGEKTAVSLGLNLSQTKLFVLIAGSLASACAVCIGGTISFVGLIAPHVMRKLFGADHHRLIPLSMAGGAILLLLSDTLARTIIAPSEIPVGIVTSLIGVPFFILVLNGNSRGNNYV